jgi:hypothetical protein
MTRTKNTERASIDSCDVIDNCLHRASSLPLSVKSGDSAGTNSTTTSPDHCQVPLSRKQYPYIHESPYVPQSLRCRGLTRGSFAAPVPVSKRERMLGWLAGRMPPTTPPPLSSSLRQRLQGRFAAAGRHLGFPSPIWFSKSIRANILAPGVPAETGRLVKLKLARLDFYEPLLQTVRELVKAEKNSLILMTLYSPFMCAGHCATTPVLQQHLEENPEAVRKGLEILTDSQLLFVRACIKGV